MANMLRITPTVLFIWHGWLSWKSVAHTQPLDVSVFQAVSLEENSTQKMVTFGVHLVVWST